MTHTVPFAAVGAVILGLFIAAEAGGATIAAATDPGPTPGDAFDYTHNGVITHSDLVAGSDIRDMFGGSFSTTGHVTFQNPGPTRWCSSSTRTCRWRDTGCT
jgi:hypothetical protein